MRGWCSFLFPARSRPGSGVTTAPIPTTPGNLLHLDVSWFHAQAQPVSVADSYGNEWTLIHSESSTDAGLRQYYAKDCLGGSGHTFTFTLNTNGYPTIAVTEINGLDPVAPKDQNSIDGEDGGVAPVLRQHHDDGRRRNPLRRWDGEPVGLEPVHHRLGLYAAIQSADDGAIRGPHHRDPDRVLDGDKRLSDDRRLANGQARGGGRQLQGHGGWRGRRHADPATFRHQAPSRHLTTWSWLPTTLWRCPRRSTTILARGAAVRCPRCGFREGT